MLDVWPQIHKQFWDQLQKLGKLDLDTAIIDSSQVRAHGGGESTGPSPVNRRKKGTKYSVLVDRNGTPLVILHSSANTSDHQQIVPTVLALEEQEQGIDLNDPESAPQDLYADAGYDSEPTRILMRFLGIEPHIRKRLSEHGSGLGRVRWVVERTIGWIKGLRRLPPRQGLEP
ncbi:transposase [Thalassoroseus pseudoceratinae]|uniref:transposase n=1 Tax=Thalassoroseus pseudoceratinae TaxID=2713176 RepID=UPI00141FCFAF|nr:transposase [Thalassoroseus pseudoceratinae]